MRSFRGRWNELKYTAGGTVTTDVVEKEVCEEVRAESCYSQCFCCLSVRHWPHGTVTTDVVEKEICEEVRAESCYSQCFCCLSVRHWPHGTRKGGQVLAIVKLNHTLCLSFTFSLASREMDKINVFSANNIKDINTLRTASFKLFKLFKLFKRPFPWFLAILTL